VSDYCQQVLSRFRNPLCWLLIFLFSLIGACGSPVAMRYPTQGERAVSLDESQMREDNVPSESQPQAESQPQLSPLTESDVSQPLTPARKIHYSAQLTLLVSQLNKAIENTMHLAESVDGYVERIDGSIAIIQVPAERFNEVLAKLVSLGKVLDKRVVSEDISERFYDSELRLKIAKQRRDRLLQLLQQASNEDDKLELLKQLERVSVVIRRLESSLEAMKKKIRYSEIRIQFELLEKFNGAETERELSGFHWISTLAQFSESDCDNDKIQFGLPDNMLRIAHIDYFRVESADEVLFQSCQRDNQPHGDSQFWLQAIKYRMQKRFSQIDELHQGDYLLLRLASQGKDSAIFYVGVRVMSEKLAWLEIKFPTQALEQKYKQAIFKVIAEKGQ